MADPLSPAQLMPLIEDITNDSQQRMANVSMRLNNAAIMQAIQEGYRLCCEQHNLPLPDFVDPSHSWNV